MRDYHHLVEGVLQPAEIDDLQKIFDVVIAQSWFDSSESNCEVFASALIKLYRGGMVDFDRLHHLATLTGLAYFSRENSEEKRIALEMLRRTESELSASAAQDSENSIGRMIGEHPDSK